MTITVAVTGGIGAGKSTVAGLLAARGALVVDSDRLAREVVGAGTPGLADVLERFGPGVIAADGTLDRPALARVVFTDPAARRDLEGIIHPLVRARFSAIQASAQPGSVVVNDIPLLTTLSAAATFHLVIGVGAPADLRIHRLVGRGLDEADARSRIAAQIDDGARRLLCDTWIDNSAGPAAARAQTELLFSRLTDFAGNVKAGRAAPRRGPVLVPYDPEWPAAADRLAARVSHAVGGARVDHIGSTAVPGFPAKDVIDLQLTVADLDQAAGWAPALAAAGFPLLPDFTVDTPHVDISHVDTGLVDTPHPDGPHADAPQVDAPPAIVDDPQWWRKSLHVNADPGRAVNLHVRAQGRPNWAWALRFRDWLRADPAARADYLAVKQAAAIAHRADPGSAGYADAKEEFLAIADRRSRDWAASSGWSPA